MTVYHLESPQFKLSLRFKVFEKDIPYASNTILTVSLDSAGFCAEADLDVDIKRIVQVIGELDALYTTLKGSTRIDEPFGEQYIAFCGDGRGHIHISGQLYSNGRHGFVQELKFENRIDQTELPEFLTGLSQLRERYGVYTTQQLCGQQTDPIK